MMLSIRNITLSTMVGKTEFGYNHSSTPVVVYVTTTDPIGNIMQPWWRKRVIATIDALFPDEEMSPGGYSRKSKVEMASEVVDYLQDSGSTLYEVQFRFTVTTFGND